MPDGQVALQAPNDEDGASRLATALSRASLRATGSQTPGGAWFLFDTPHGQGAFRPISLGGLSQPEPRDEDGTGAAAQVEAAEATLAAIEAVLGIAIRPAGLGPAPEGLTIVTERAEAGDVIALLLPAALAETLPPSEAAEGAVVHRVRAAAPALGAADIPMSGDVLMLGAAPVCEAAPMRPVGALAFTTTLSAPDAGGGVPATPAGGGAVVALEALLTPQQAAALRGGEALLIGDGLAPAATYTSGETVRTGTLTAMSGMVWFRFD